MSRNSNSEPKLREKFASRLGFILVSAGCAIGLGNVWRFPYITGEYGGAWFVLIYILFLVIMGIPLLTMELAVGRASEKSIAESFDKLESIGSSWHRNKWWMIFGNYVLLSFYTVVSGWVFCYFVNYLDGSFVGIQPSETGNNFQKLTTDYSQSLFYTFIAIAFGMIVCFMGVRRGVEKVSRQMMQLLLIALFGLAIYVLFLKDATRGLEFYLVPDFEKLKTAGIGNAICAAMGQAFFTLGLGVGSMQIFGSYLNKDRSLVGEATLIACVDTLVALLAGFIIFPAAFSYGVSPDQGPKLLFITLVNVFNGIPFGQYVGTVFFLLMVLASFSTLIAVFENIIAVSMELFNISRGVSVAINFALVLLLALPCVLGFSLWDSFTPFGAGSNVLDLEDFILSCNILPLGALVYLFFCMKKSGFGEERFYNEVNTGKGFKLSRKLSFYLRYILPILIFAIYVFGYIDKFNLLEMLG